MPTRAARRWSMLIIVLLCTYFVAGVFGRFPWKADEPYSFGIVWEMIEDNSWLIPQVADQAFVEKPPLVYWLGAGFAKLLPMVPPYESSRVAILLLIAASVIPLYFSAKWMHPEVVLWVRAAGPRDPPVGPALPGRSASPGTYALLAIVLMAGTLGFPEHLHKLTADLGQLAGAVIGLCGLVHIGTAQTQPETKGSRASIVGGLLLGTGAGVAFMSKGLLVPGILATTWLGCLLIGLPSRCALRYSRLGRPGALMSAYRRHLGAAAIAAALASAPWLFIWPFLLHQASPSLFDEWFWNNNFGRFLGYVALGGNSVSFGSKTLATLVMGFPPLLLCAWVVARTWGLDRSGDSTSRWTALRDAPAHLCVAIYVAISLIVLGVSASMRDIYLLPVLPAMILLGLPAVALEARRPLPHAKRWLDFGFAAIVLLVGLVWLSLVVSGNLSLWPWLRGIIGQWLPLPFRLAVSWPAAIAAATTVVVWSYIVRHDPLRSATIAWCSGIAMVWIVVSALLLPWIDAARSYKAIFTEVTPHIAASDGCVATLNLGESELALLDYVTDSKMDARITRSHLGHSGTGDRSRPNAAANACDKLLVLSNRASGRLSPDSTHWKQVWTGSRPADASEEFTLYRKHDDPRRNDEARVETSSKAGRPRS